MEMVPFLGLVFTNLLGETMAALWNMQGRLVCFNKSEKGNQNKPRNSDRSSKISSLTGILGELTWELWCDMHRNGGEDF